MIVDLDYEFIEPFQFDFKCINDNCSGRVKYPNIYGEYKVF